MKKNFKRVLSAALVVVMLLTAFPAAFAFGSKETDYTIISPYEQVDWSTWKTYKANLHAHCDASDGDPTLDEMVEEYYKADYDILAMTDHGVITNGWTSERETNGIFNKFRKVYPMSEENYERITKGLDRGGRGMTDIRGGIECNMAVISKTHVNGYFTTYGQGEWGIENDYRTAPVEIEKAGGYSVLNHVGDWVDSSRFPHRSHWNVYIAYFAGIFIDCPSCLGMEIVNNTDRVTRGDRELWDELLQVVIPKGRNIWAFADDDSEKLNEVGRSFEFFVLPENNEANVKKAMKDGNFFAASKYYKTTDGVGDFDGDGSMKIFPVAKSTEVMLFNDTDWQPFAEATGASYDDLATWEGIYALAERYAADTGKCFLVNDYHFNYFQVGVTSLGEDFFQNDGVRFGSGFLTPTQRWRAASGCRTATPRSPSGRGIPSRRWRPPPACSITPTR